MSDRTGQRGRPSLAAVLVLLDLDGTLTDPYEGISRCVAHALATLGRPPLTEAELRSFVGPPLQDRFAALGLDEADVERAVALYRERFADVGLYENRVYDGVPEALVELRAAGHRLGVATSKPTPFAERIVAHFGLDEHLEAVVGATLDGTRRAKADVVAFALDTLRGHGVGGTMVGDRAQDVVGGRAHGLRTVGVTWGFAEPGELETAGADVLVDVPARLVEAVEA